MKKIEQATNQGIITGVLSEKALALVTTMAKDEKGNATISCEVIRGSITVETKNGIFKLRVYSQSKKKNSEENPMFKGFKTILTEYISKAELAQDCINYKIGEAKIKDADLKSSISIPIYKNEESVEDINKKYIIANSANKISCNVQANINDYIGLDKQIKSSVQMSMSRANRVSNDTEDSTDIEIVGVIRSITNEIFDEEETGRKIVEFINVTYTCDANPLKLIINEELVDDFESMFEIGQTCQLYCEIVMKHVGTKATEKASFGRKAEIFSGFDVLEIQVIGGEDPFEDDDEETSKCYSIAQMKQLMSERKIVLDNLLSENKEKSTPKNKQNPFGSKKSTSDFPKGKLEDFADGAELPYDVIKKEVPLPF